MAGPGSTRLHLPQPRKRVFALSGNDPLRHAVRLRSTSLAAPVGTASRSRSGRTAYPGNQGFSLMSSQSGRRGWRTVKDERSLRRFPTMLRIVGALRGSALQFDERDTPLRSAYGAEKIGSPLAAEKVGCSAGITMDRFDPAAIRFSDAPTMRAAVALSRSLGTSFQPLRRQCSRTWLRSG